MSGGALLGYMWLVTGIAAAILLWRPHRNIGLSIIGMLGGPVGLGIGLVEYFNYRGWS